MKKKKNGIRMNNQSSLLSWFVIPLRSTPNRFCRYYTLGTYLSRARSGRKDTSNTSGARAVLLFLFLIFGANMLFLRT